MREGGSGMGKRGRGRVARSVVVVLGVVLAAGGLAAAPAVAAVTPNLTVTVSNNAPGPATANASFRYSITIANTAPVVEGDPNANRAYQVANLVQTLPADIKYVSTSSVTPVGGVGTPPTYNPSGTGFGGTLTFSNVADVPAGGSVTIVVNAQVDGAPLSGSDQVSTATIASYADQPSGTPGTTFGPAQGSSTVAITGRTLSVLGNVITPQVNGDGGLATIGDQVRYTFTYTMPNNTRYASAVLGACLPLGFHYVAGSYVATTTGGTIPGFTSPNTEGAGRFNPAATGAGAACHSDQQWLTVKVPDFANAGPAITLQVQLTALITGKNNAGTLVLTTYPGANAVSSAGAANDVSTAFVNSNAQVASAHDDAIAVFVPHLSLGVTRVRPSSPAVAGSTVDFLVSLKNDGGSTAYQVADLLNTFDDGMTGLTAYSSDGTCQTASAAVGATQSGQVVDVPVPGGQLAPGATLYVCAEGTVPATAVPESTYRDTVTGPSYSSAPASYTGAAYAVPDASASISTPPSADLKIGITDGSDTAVPGNHVTYTVVATNDGPSNAPGAQVGVDLPAALTGTWTCTGAGGATCTANGTGSIDDRVDLPHDSSVTYVVTADLAAAATGTLTSAATITRPTSVPDPDPSNNGASDTDTLTPQADLSITKSDGLDSAHSGASVTYTITATNDGPSDAPGAKVSDTLPSSLTGSWTCVGSGATCTTSGSGSIDDTVSLPAGSHVTYTVSAAIAPSARASVANTASVAPSSSVTETDPSDNSSTDTDVLVASATTTTGTPSGSSVVVGTATTDSVVVSGTSAPSGAVSFAICGPLASADGCATGGTDLGSTPLASPTVSASYTPLLAGTYCYRATYGGDTGNTSSSDATASQCFTATTAPTSTSITSVSPTSPVHGQSPTVTATVTTTYGAVSGTVQFAVDSVDVGVPVAVGTGGTATSVALTGLSTTGHPVIATFTPSDPSVHAGSQGQGTVTIGKASSTTTVSVTPSQIVAHVATVAPGAGTPTGTVTFSVGGVVKATASVDSNGDATASYVVPTGGSRSVAAVYSGDADVLGSSGSTARNDPLITAVVTSASPRSASGWYAGPVTVTFTCTEQGAALAVSCPSPVLLSNEGASQSVSGSVTAVDGGAATATVTGIGIDTTRPTVAVAGVSDSVPYFVQGPDGTCSGSDVLSGIASCTLTRALGAGAETYTATATDRAGNTSSASLTVPTTLLTVRAHKFSASAKEKIAAAGGTATEI